MNKKLAVVMALVLVLGASASALPVGASSVNPVWYDDNPTCAYLGYAYGMKIDPPAPGTYPLGPGTFTWDGSVADGWVSSWSSTFGVDAIIMKGGDNANVYFYSPESKGDTNLYTPTNPNNNKPYGISHIDVCYDYEVQVSKDAQTSYTRTYTWEIDKSVTPADWAMFAGDSGTSKYTVTLTKHVTDSDFAVKGTITITNPDPNYVATITGVTDSVNGTPATVDCGVTFPYDLPVGGTLQCSYSASLPDKSTRTNTATVTTTGKVGGGSATAPVVFGDPTTVVGYPTVNVTDSYGGNLGAFSESGSVSYERTFTCPTDLSNYGQESGKYSFQRDNTATIDETKQYDDASVKVDCYVLGVKKSATTSFTRTYHWTVDKTADQTALTLSPGQQFLVNYEVTVDATYTDSDWAVAGKIYVKNFAPFPATIKSITDIVSPDIAASVDCPFEFPYSLPGGWVKECTYSADLPDAAERINTATATLQNYDYNYLKEGTLSGTTDFSGTKKVTFGGPTTEVDKCADVTDTYAGSLGTVCYPNVPQTFKYSRWVGPYYTCGLYTVDNTATVKAKDTETESTDSWRVNVTVPCAGCTLTQGYWKTHSKYGPAPYDDTWALLGEDTTFFQSGLTYYQVLWTSPSGGNAYYILAHQYIAAKLNFLNGADPSAAQAAFNAATALFNLYTPDYVAGLKGKAGTDLRAQFIALASILDAYNTGYIGPGHCSE